MACDENVMVRLRFFGNEEIGQLSSAFYANIRRNWQLCWNAWQQILMNILLNTKNDWHLRYQSADPMEFHCVDLQLFFLNYYSRAFIRGRERREKEMKRIFMGVANLNDFTAAVQSNNY